MLNGKRWVLTVFLSLAVLIFSSASCSNSEGDNKEISPQTTTEPAATPITPIDAPQIPARGFFKGVLPLPAEGQQIDEAYAHAGQYIDFAPVWASGIGASDYADYAQKLTGLAGNLFVDQLIRGNGMFPIIHFSFIDKDQSSGNLILKTLEGIEGTTLRDKQFGNAYKQAILDALVAVSPLYLSAGNEVNRWYEEYGTDGPNGFQHFVSLYEEIYDSVKQLSPKTNVFCTFSREVVSELRKADLSVLSLFDPNKLDILVFTSYPHSVRKDVQGNMLSEPFNRPLDIPNDYYSRAYDYIDMANKPFGFSEVSWPSTDEVGGENAQAIVIDQVAGRLTRDQDVDLKLFGWPWLRDLGPYDDTGLIERDGSEKKAYDVWRNL